MLCISRSKKSLTLLIIFLICFQFFTSLSSVSARVTVNQDDGIWRDDFSDSFTVRCTDCWVNETDGTIMLNESENKRHYDLAQEADHNAWEYVSFFFNPLLSPKLDFYKEEFDDIEFPFLTKNDKRYTETKTTGLRRFAVNQFKFTLDGNADLVGDLTISWIGNSTNDLTTRLYCYKYLPGTKTIGFWDQLDQAQSDNKRIFLQGLISKENVNSYLDSDNTIYVSISSGASSGSTALQTDYVRIDSEAKGFLIGEGAAITNRSIQPRYDKNKFYWEKISWIDSEPGDATIRYQIGTTNETGAFTPFSNSILSGNEDGFTDSPVYITSIPASQYKSFKIRMLLSTKTPQFSPRVDELTVTWQTDAGLWQDLFTTQERIDTSNGLNISEDDGFVDVKPIVGDWVMAGHNPQNTRASEGRGPETSTLNWYYSNLGAGEGFPLTDPVIFDDVLYISHSDYENIYRLESIYEKGSDTFHEYVYSPIVQQFNYDLDMENSPVITDEYVIVATGRNTDPDGARNYILGFDKSSTSKTPSPVFEFEYGENICYWASPIVAENMLYITSWTGDDSLPLSNDNNKVLALDLEKSGKLSSEDLTWEFDLPAPSYSTPSYYDNIVYAGCDREIGKNLFALDAASGEEIWNASVGRIGLSSPVIYKDVVYMLSDSMGNVKITAFNAYNGSRLWRKIIGLSSPLSTYSTPAIANDVLYVMTVKGKVLALDITDEGKTIWTEDFYFGTDQIAHPPTVAHGIVYVSTSLGTLFALNAENGDRVFSRNTRDNSPIVTAPVVSNGLVFFGDKNGWLYSIGAYKEPTDQISGTLVSIPISLPENKWWDTFQALYNETTGGSITFSILDQEKNLLQTISTGDSVSFENQTIHRTIRLQAALEAQNASFNPKLYGWNISFSEDNVAPWLKRTTFTPGPWLTELAYDFSLDVQDNLTGLDTASAQYTVTYTTLNGTLEKTVDADCTGNDGSNRVESITINLTDLEDYQQIIDIQKITVSIMDLAGNTADESFNIVFDNDKPTSQINTDVLESRYTSSAVIISATASDSGENRSGVEKVELYYRYSTSDSFSGEWDLYEDDYTAPYSWELSYANVDEKSGYYQFLSNAVDNAGNAEQEITSTLAGEVLFLFDPIQPDPPEIDSDTDDDTFWFNRSTISSITFSDDFQLDTIEYRPNFETEWEQIASNIGSKTYANPWSITDEHWEFINEGELYYLSFRITDTAGNTYTTESGERLALRKDIKTPQVNLEIGEEETEWSWNDTLTISAFSFDDDGSGIKSMTLQYIFSEDNNFENASWKNYETINQESYEFSFKAEEGDGYYKFRLLVEDYAGNIVNSSVLLTGVNRFPTDLITAFAAVSVVLIILLVVALLYWRKQRK